MKFKLIILQLIIIYNSKIVHYHYNIDNNLSKVQRKRDCRQKYGINLTQCRQFNDTIDMEKNKKEKNYVYEIREDFLNECSVYCRNDTFERILKCLRNCNKRIS